MVLDSATLDRAAAYRLFIDVVVPRPIAWVGSRSAAGVDNLAPFSYFMGVSASPPTLAVSVARLRDGRPKDTARNVLETGEFTVSLVELGQLDAMHATSAPWPGSEFEAVGLAAAPGVRVAAPRPAQARVALECRLVQAHDVGNAQLLIGEIVAWHVDDALWNGEAVVGFRPVARLGGDAYAEIGAEHRRPAARLPPEPPTTPARGR